MKNTNYIIHGILGIAVVVLFILHFTGSKRGETNPARVVKLEDSTITLPIAYFNSDSLLQKYTFAQDLNEELMRKIENSNTAIRKEEKKLTDEVLAFQEKIQLNSFLSEDRALQERKRIERKGQELQELAQRKENEWRMEQAKVIQQISDTIVAAVKEFNLSRHYHVIFNNQHIDNIVVADEQYNITQELLEFLNRRYKK